jgi:hypothetical protein
MLVVTVVMVSRASDRDDAGQPVRAARREPAVGDGKHPRPLGYSPQTSTLLVHSTLATSLYLYSSARHVTKLTLHLPSNSPSRLTPPSLQLLETYLHHGAS